MKYKIGNDLLAICREILIQKKTSLEWSAIESDDMFQIGRYVGGYDATEDAFCFSFYEDEKEYWFQISLNDVQNIADGKLNEIEIRSVE